MHKPSNAFVSPGYSVLPVTQEPNWACLTLCPIRLSCFIRPGRVQAEFLSGASLYDKTGLRTSAWEEGLTTVVNSGGVTTSRLLTFFLFLALCSQHNELEQAQRAAFVSVLAQLPGGGRVISGPGGGNGPNGTGSAKNHARWTVRPREVVPKRGAPHRQAAGSWPGWHPGQDLPQASCLPVRG